MSAVSGASGSSVMVERPDKKPIILSPGAAQHHESQQAIHKAEREKKEEGIQERLAEIRQLKVFQDKISSLTLYSRELANNLNVSDNSSGIYAKNATNITTDLPHVNPDEYLVASYGSAAPQIPVTIRIERLASYAQVSAAETFDSLSTPLATKGISDGETLQIGTTTIALNADDTLQSLIEKINTQSTTSGVEASYIKLGSSYRLGLNSKILATDITFGTETSAGVLTNLGLSDSTGNYTGIVHINGIQETISDNTLDIGEGRILVLLKTHTTATFTVNVEKDATEIVNTVQNFVGALNLLIQEIQWQEGVPNTQERPEEKEPLLATTRVLAQAKKIVRDIARLKVSHASDGYQSLADLSIVQEPGQGQGDIGYFKLNPDKLKADLISNFDKVKDLFSNQKAFKPGGNEGNYRILSGPLRSFNALNEKDISVVLRYASDSETYHADFSVEAPGDAGMVTTTSSVEFDGAQNFISADKDSIFAGIIVKNILGNDLSRLSGGPNETITMTFKMGLAGKAYYSFLALENADGTYFPKGSVVTLTETKKRDITRLQSDLDRLVKRQEQEAKILAKKLERLTNAQAKLDAVRQRHETLKAMGQVLGK